MDHGGLQWKIMKQKAFNKHRGLTRKKTHVSPLAFYNTDIVLMREYFSDMTFFNLKIESIDVL
jgi:hypothetical protein